MGEEIYQRTFNQVMELYILPEITRRIKGGVLPDSFALSSAQVLLYSDGRKPMVRLNKETKIVAKAKLKNGIKKRKGEQILPVELDRLEGMRHKGRQSPFFV